ncbi:MAG: hypothetical protein ACLQUY_22995 [Ktedonobacterales bacterium]
MSNPNLNMGTPLTDPNSLGRYFYSGSRQGIVFVTPNTKEMQKGVFGGLFQQGWRFATDQEIHEYTQSQIPSYPVQEPEPEQPAQPEPEPQPQRQPAGAPTPRRTAVAEPEKETERETETTEDVAQEIARLKHQLQLAEQKLAESQREE